MADSIYTPEQIAWAEQLAERIMDRKAIVDTLLRVGAGETIMPEAPLRSGAPALADPSNWQLVPVPLTAPIHDLFRAAGIESRSAWRNILEQAPKPPFRFAKIQTFDERN